MDNESTISSEKYHEQLSLTAYSVGCILGDGCFQQYSEKYENGKWYSRKNIQIAKRDKDVIARVRDEIEKVFGVRYSIFKRCPTNKTNSDIYHLRVGRKDVFDFFSINTNYKAKIPEFYFSAKKNIKRELVAGLMDSDGYITVSTIKQYTQYQLGFSMTNRDIVAGIANIMRSLGVKVGKLGEYNKGQYRTMYGINPNIRSFNDAGCYFHSKRKSGRIKDYLSCIHLKKSHVLSSETGSVAPLT